jgi:hypothetical protein
MLQPCFEQICYCLLKEMLLVVCQSCKHELHDVPKSLSIGRKCNLASVTVSQPNLHISETLGDSSHFYTEQGQGGICWYYCLVLFSYQASFHFQSTLLKASTLTVSAAHAQLQLHTFHSVSVVLRGCAPGQSVRSELTTVYPQCGVGWLLEPAANPGRRTRRLATGWPAVSK